MSPEKKRAYNRELMRKMRAKRGDAVTQEDTKDRDFKPFRAPNGNFILKPPSRPYDETHVHHYTRRLGEETAQCNTCSEVAKYEGKLLNIYNDGLPDWPQLIRESAAAPHLQKKMPSTPKR